MRRRYLFIRILEACNANCFMCGFALSRDRYRFGLDELKGLLPEARALGFGYVRFTGGEPLMHQDFTAMVAAVRQAGLFPSVITNGASLAKRADDLASAGLAQAIVSIDGATAETHDSYRLTPGLFQRCVDGLNAMRARGVRTRVNTVAGPHNYRELPRLQDLLSDLSVDQWELSALKLDEGVRYPDPEDVLATCERIYSRTKGRYLVPLGKRFYGDTPEERQLFFENGIPPRPSAPRCHLVGDAIYLDGKGGVAFGCSMLSHRDVSQSGGGVPIRDGRHWHLKSALLDAHVATFSERGPRHCVGCSSSAAGYSDAVARDPETGAWAF